jgi:hypothetical protein
MQVRPCVHLACREKIYGVQAAARSLDRSIAVVGLVRTEPCVRAPGIIAGIETLPHLLLEPGHLFLSLSLSFPLLLPPPSSPLSASVHHLAIEPCSPAASCKHQSLTHRDISPGQRPTQSSKHGFGCAVRAPVLRALHLLQHRTRGKLLEKPDPKRIMRDAVQQ